MKMLNLQLTSPFRYGTYKCLVIFRCCILQMSLRKLLHFLVYFQQFHLPQVLRKINWITRTKLLGQLQRGIQLLIGHVKIIDGAVLIFRASPFIIPATNSQKLFPRNLLNQDHIHQHSSLANIQTSIRGDGNYSTAVHILKCTRIMLMLYILHTYPEHITSCFVLQLYSNRAKVFPTEHCCVWSNEAQ